MTYAFSVSWTDRSGLRPVERTTVSQGRATSEEYMRTLLRDWYGRDCRVHSLSLCERA